MFLDGKDFKTIWQLAHNWVGVDPDKTDAHGISAELKEIIHRLMLSSFNEEISIRTRRWTIFDNGYYLNTIIDYAHFRKFKQCLREDKFDKPYLDSLYVKRNEVLSWCANIVYLDPPPCWIPKKLSMTEHTSVETVETTIGVLPRTTLTTRGTRTSTMATRTTIRTTRSVCGLFGVLNKTYVLMMRVQFDFVTRVFFAVETMQQLSLFDFEQDTKPTIELTNLFEAYFDCRKNKRNTLNAIAFEVDYEANLLKLCRDINDGSYQPGKSIAFIVNKPVKREIFAADFRDRVVHHLVINKLNPLFEKIFIHDSYAYRVGKGAHFGIKRADCFIRQCSHNYTRDCYVLKLDIKGFFMHINKILLFAELQRFIEQKYQQLDRALLLELCQKIIMYDLTQHCVIKSRRREWLGLPSDKSLFHSAPFCGLPIGNLTSQIFANFYLNPFDHFIKHDCGIRYYGRYVDDFILVHQDSIYLKSLIPVIKTFLKNQLQLTLHPNKIYFQHYSKGVQFLGAVIKPNRIYIAKRTQGNFYTAIQKQNLLVKEQKPNRGQQAGFLSSMNSYLGMMKHYKTHKLRKRMLFRNLSSWWWNRVYLSGGMAKFVLKKNSETKEQILFVVYIVSTSIYLYC